MLKRLLAALTFLVLPYQAHATTPRMGLNLFVIGSLNWGNMMNNNFSILDSSAAILASTNTFTQLNQFTAPVVISSGLTASSGTFTASGNSQFSLLVSSGVSVGAGVFANFFVGNGAALTGVTSSPSGAAGGDLSGTYPNPLVSHTQAGSVSFSTITTALADKASLTVYNNFLASQTFSAAGGVDVTYGLRVGSMSIGDGLTSSSGSFTLTGGANFSLQTSSSIRILAGGLRWADGTVSTTAAILPSGTSGQIAYFSGINDVRSSSAFTFNGKSFSMTGVTDAATGSTSGSISLAGGDGSVASGGHGGPISLNGGIGGATGGDITATAGGSGSFSGGSLTLGAAGSSSSGNASLSAGGNSAGGTFNGGALSLSGGNVTVGTGKGGNLSITAGSGLPSGPGGDITISGGSGGTSSGTITMSVTPTSLVVSTGGIGVGIASPRADLHVLQSSAVAGIRIDHYSSDNVGTAFIGHKARGSQFAPAAVSTSDRLSTFGGLGYDGAAFPSSSTANIQIIAAETFGTTNHGTNIVFNATPIGSTVTAQAGILTGSGALTIVSSVTASEFFGGIHRSSFTIVPNVTFTNTTFGICVATVPISVSTNSFIDVRFSGQIQNANNTQSVRLTILVDGAFTAQYGATGITSHNIGTINGSNVGMGFAQVIDTPLAFGTHNVCLAPDVSGGTGSIITDATEKSRFGVIEIR